MTLSGVDMFCFVASIVSVVFVVPPLRNWIASCMPSAKMQVLETLLCETEGLLRSALEEGTIDYAHYENKIHEHMWQAKLQTDGLRAKVYNIRGFQQELVAWCFGLSGRIASAIDKLQFVRGEIASSSSGGRDRLAKEGCTTNPTLVVFSKGHIPHHDLPLPPRSVVAATSHPELPHPLTPPPAHAQSTAPSHYPVATDETSKTEHAEKETSSTTRPKFPTMPIIGVGMARGTWFSERRHAAHRSVLFGMGQKLVSPTDVHRIAPNLPASPLKHQGMCTSRLRALTGFFRGPAMTLPRHTSDFAALGLSASPQFTGKNANHGGDAGKWTEKGHVVVEVRLPA